MNLSKNYTVYQMQDNQGNPTDINLYKWHNFDINEAYKRREALAKSYAGTKYTFEVREIQ